MEAFLKGRHFCNAAGTMSAKRAWWGLAIGYAVEVWLVHLLSRHGDFLLAGEASKFAVIGVAAGLGYWVATGCFERAALPAYQSAWVFWLGAVVLRLLVLPIMPGDDLWRYRWEGLIQLHGFNPYALSPDAPVLAPLRDADWLKINHRDFAAIYPPVTEACFATLAWFGNSVWLYKIVFGAVDLASCGVLRRLLARQDGGGEQAAWYAWNPLAVYAFAGAAHFDCLMILPLLGAIWALDKYPAARPAENGGAQADWKTPLLWLSILLLGVAAAVKIVPLALFPVWVFAAASWRRALGLFPVCIAPLAISAFAYGFPRVPIFATLQQFGQKFRVNDLVWSLLKGGTTATVSANNGMIEAGTVCTLLLLAFWLRRDWRCGLMWVWGAALLLSPVVHAWYVVWLLPIAAWRGPSARAWFVLSISMFGYFLLWEVNHASGRPWEEPLWLRMLIYIPPAMAAAWIVLRPRLRRLPCEPP
jgi:alpha-1,6-mannosyltransferase